MELSKEANKEKERMRQVIDSLKIKCKNEKAKQFCDMVKNYFFDGCFFLEKGKELEAFEAFIISWAYVDAGLKLKFFEVPASQKKWFTA
jgi:hypothetical protein